MRAWRLAGWILLLVGSMASGPAEASAAADPSAASERRKGLRFELKYGSAADTARETLLQAAAEPLDAARTEALLKRVPPLEADGDEAQDFALREASTPPPRTSATVEAPWPPTADLEAPVPPGSDGAPRAAAPTVRLCSESLVGCGEPANRTKARFCSSRGIQRDPRLRLAAD